MQAIANRQRGVSFSGFIVILVLLVVAAIFSMKLIPHYMDSGKIQKTMDAIVRDPLMQNAQVDDIRMAFYKRAISMDNVTALSENDVEVYKENGKLFMSASYKVKVPVAGNVSLLLEFNPSAPQ
jgi:hypothetical protein